MEVGVKDRLEFESKDTCYFKNVLKCLGATIFVCTKKCTMFLSWKSKSSFFIKNLFTVKLSEKCWITTESLHICFN